MHVNISGQHMDLGESLQQEVQERCRGVVDKYLNNSHKNGETTNKIDVHFTKTGKTKRLFETEIIFIIQNRDLTIKANAQGFDAYEAFHIAIARIEKQLRRYKDKINTKHKSTVGDVEPKTKKNITGTKYVIESSYSEASEEQEQNPIVIAEKSTTIEELTVSEAVMKMDLMDLPALAFINKANGSFNFIYYRQDGNISWVEPKQQ